MSQVGEGAGEFIVESALHLEGNEGGVVGVAGISLGLVLDCDFLLLKHVEQSAFCFPSCLDVAAIDGYLFVGDDCLSVSVVDVLSELLFPGGFAEGGFVGGSDFEDHLYYDLILYY